MKLEKPCSSLPLHTDMHDVPNPIHTQTIERSH